ncbi:putative monocarboxylate transporter [Ixodes scapularis]
MVVPPRSFTRQVRSSLFRFFWMNKTELVTRQVLSLPREKGGWGFPCVDGTPALLQLKTMLMILHEAENPARSLALYFVGHSRRDLGVDLTGPSGACAETPPPAYWKALQLYRRLVEQAPQLDITTTPASRLAQALLEPQLTPVQIGLSDSFPWILGLQICDRALYGSVVELPGCLVEDLGADSPRGFTTGILIHFFDTRTLTMAGTLLATMSAVACFLWNHFTIYLVFIGLGFGTSSGITVPVNVVALSRYFRLHRTSANGLNFAGASVGSFLIPPLLAGFLDRYGLGGTMLVVGALMLNAMAGGIVLRSSADYPQCRGQFSRGEDAEDGSIDGSVHRSELCSTEFLLCESGVLASSVAQLPRWKISKPRDMSRQGPASFLWKPVFYSLTLTGIVYSFVFSSYLITIVDHVQGVLGVTNQQASLFVSVMAAGDLISRLGTGCLADLGYVDCETLLVVNFAALAACYALLAHVDSLLQFGLVAFVFGLNNGGTHRLAALPAVGPPRQTTSADDVRYPQAQHGHRNAGSTHAHRLFQGRPWLLQRSVLPDQRILRRHRVPVGPRSGQKSLQALPHFPRLLTGLTRDLNVINSTTSQQPAAAGF